MKFGTFNDLDTLKGTALLRVDFNSPIDPASGLILDDKRFREHLPTVRALEDAKCVILAHQSRPGKKDFTTLSAHADKLEKLIGRHVKYIDDIFGRCARDAVQRMDAGDVLMLENIRFSSEEILKLSGPEAAQTHLVRSLSSMGDYFVNDAFGTAHRSQPSIVGLPFAMKSVAGILMEKEVKTLSRVFTDAPSPVTFVLGGTKVDDSLDVAKNVLDSGIADQVMAVGVVANVFLFAKGINVGKPAMELIRKLGYISEIEKAKEILSAHEDKVIIPDNVAVREEGIRAEYPVDKIPQDLPVLDLGIDSLAEFTGIIKIPALLYLMVLPGFLKRRSSQPELLNC